MLFIRLLRDEQGSTGIEYAAIAALVSTAGISAMTSVGDQVLNYYQSLSERAAFVNEVSADSQ